MFKLKEEQLQAVEVTACQLVGGRVGATSDDKQEHKYIINDKYTW